MTPEELEEQRKRLRRIQRGLSGLASQLAHGGGKRVQTTPPEPPAPEYGPDIWDDVGVYLGGNETSSFTKVARDAFNVAVTVEHEVSVDRPLVTGHTTGKVSGKVYELSFDADVISGVPVIFKFYDGSNVEVNYTIVPGLNQLVGTATANNTELSWYFAGTQVFDVKISNIKVREVLNA